MANFYKYQFNISTSSTDIVPPSEIDIVYVGVAFGGSNKMVDLLSGCYTKTNYSNAIEIEHSYVSGGSVIDITFSSTSDTQKVTLSSVTDSNSGYTYSGTLYLWVTVSSHEYGEAVGDKDITSIVHLSTGEVHKVGLNGGSITTSSNPSWLQIDPSLVELCEDCGYNNSSYNGVISLDDTSQSETAMLNVYSAMDDTNYVSPSKINVTKTYENNNYKFTFTVDGFTPSSDSQPATLDEIINHLGTIKYPTPDYAVYIGNDDEKAHSSEWEIIDADLVSYDSTRTNGSRNPPVIYYDYGQAKEVFTITNSNLYLNACSFTIDACSLTIRVQFGVSTAFSTTGNWNIGYLSPSILPGHAWDPKPGYTSYRGGLTVGYSDGGNTVFGILAYPVTVDGNQVIYFQGLGYCTRAKSTPGCPVTTDYFFSTTLYPNIHAMIEHYDVCKDYMICHFARTEAYAKYDSSDTTLTFFRDSPGKYTDGQTDGTITYFTGIETTNYTSSGSYKTPWYDSTSYNFETVIFKDKIIPVSCCYWFCSRSGCTSIIGLYLLDTHNVTNMFGMFVDAIVSTTNRHLDLSTFDTSNVTNMTEMFGSQTQLETIYVSDRFVTDNVTNSSYMFNSCTSLVGQEGTAYNSSYRDKTYARIDKQDTPGYFSEK